MVVCNKHWSFYRMLIIGGLAPKLEIHLHLLSSLIVGEESDRSVLFNNAVNSQAGINSGVYKLNVCFEQTILTHSLP